MSVESIGLVPGIEPPLATPGNGLPTLSGIPAPAPGFAQMISNGLESLNQQLTASQADVQSLALGDTQSLHHVMIGLEETRLAFQLAVQVRNRLLEAYQDVMRMQV